jgi:hypothetical protein
VLRARLVNSAMHIHHEEMQKMVDELPLIGG